MLFFAVMPGEPEGRRTMIVLWTVPRRGQGGHGKKTEIKSLDSIGPPQFSGWEINALKAL
jgi:hypothetical protein